MAFQAAQMNMQSKKNILLLSFTDWSGIAEHLQSNTLSITVDMPGKRLNYLHCEKAGPLKFYRSFYNSFAYEPGLKNILQIAGYFFNVIW